MIFSVYLVICVGYKFLLVSEMQMCLADVTTFESFQTGAILYRESSVRKMFSVQFWLEPG